MMGEKLENWPDPINESDLYCINIFVDDRDFDLRPWDQNGGRICPDDKDILREMWRLFHEAEDKKGKREGKREGKDRSTKSINRKETQQDHTIKNRLMQLGYGFIRKPIGKRK